MITEKDNDDAKILSSWMDRCHELELEVVELKRKKLVTKEFVKEWAEKIYHPILWNDLLAELKQMLKEADAEVEE